MSNLIRKALIWLKRSPYAQWLAWETYSHFAYSFLSGKALPPLSVALELTYRCNLSCQMCYHHRAEINPITREVFQTLKERELSFDEIKKLIDDMADLGVKVLSLHGGEPLLKSDFDEIVLYAKQKGIILSMITNALTITEEKAQFLMENIDDLGVSIYGPPEIHDTISCAPGSFNRTLNSLKLLLNCSPDAARKITCYILITASNQDFLEEIFDILAEIGVKKIGFGNLVYATKEQVSQTETILREFHKNGIYIGSMEMPEFLLKVEGKKVALTISNIYKKAGEAGIKITMSNLKSPEVIDAYHNNPDFCLATHCNYPWAVTVVSPWGDVHPCIPLSFSGITMGNIREKSLKEIWNSPQYIRFRQVLKKIKLLPICPKCCMIR